MDSGDTFMSSPDIEKHIFYLESDLNQNEPFDLPLTREIIVLLRELQERRQAKHPDEIRERLTGKYIVDRSLTNDWVRQGFDQALKWVLNTNSTEKKVD